MLELIVDFLIYYVKYFMILSFLGFFLTNIYMLIQNFRLKKHFFLGRTMFSFYINIYSILPTFFNAHSKYALFFCYLLVFCINILIHPIIVGSFYSYLVFKSECTPCLLLTYLAACLCIIYYT